MSCARDTLIILDITDRVLILFKDILEFLQPLHGPSGKNELLRKLYITTKDIIDDLITENLYWTKEGTVAISEKYIKIFNIRDECESEVLDLFDSYIVTMEEILDSQHILPSWSFFDVQLKSNNVIIYSYGDYRIEDWMKRHGKKIKRCRLPR